MNDKILKAYNRAIRKSEKLEDKIGNLQRRKDYEVTKLDKRYENKIGVALDEKAQLEDYIAYIKKVIK